MKRSLRTRPWSWKRRRRTARWYHRKTKALYRLIKDKLNLTGWDDKRVEKLNRIAAVLNRDLPFCRDGFPVVEAEVNCVKCGKSLLLWADVGEWTLRSKVWWRRGKQRRTKGSVSWGGVSDTCCGLFYASQPDGQIHAYGPK